MTARPSVMAALTVATLMFSSSSQMPIEPPSSYRRVVASPKAAAPSLSNSRATYYSDAPPLVTGPYWAVAFSTRAPSKISAPSASLPSRKVR